ncbi:ABC transporter substrate-binding protein [Rhodobium gokarnense]|uniref:Spermidine/putrescine transport system substrate-binding protein n=1 Tax=Rhodobium gokarnense TaxID=364296 RepID=A0ABT3HG54_9HYPH|nr:ABC transporter substrate-binding protein [Rhodobium gokarnense]MCW2309372.1 putative spermidine/putrescine transport system substrate-binding protein [Rhodobium gokarnense]
MSKTTKTLPPTPTRRRFLEGLGTGILAAPFVLSARRTLAADALVLVTWGGAYADVIRKAITTPFTEETGIGVTLVSGPDLSKAKAQVTTGNLEWDLYDGSGGSMHNAAKEGLFEELDTSVIDTSNLVGEATAHAMPFLIYAGGIAFDPERTPSPPRTFKQLFDGDAYPGRIGLRTRVSETLEIALLADGVDPKDLYPLDVDRAFAALERIKPRVAKWIAQTPQTISLLSSNEIDYSYTYNGRVASAKADGLSIDFSTDQTILMTQYYSVLKGSPKREQAMAYIAYATRPEVQTRLSEAYYSVPVRPGALDQVAPEVKALLPDPKDPRTVLLKEAFWADNFITLDRRFKEFLLA